MLSICHSGGPQGQPPGAQSRGSWMERGPGGVNGYAQHDESRSGAV